MEHFSYKSIKYYNHLSINAIEINLAQNGISNDEIFIEKMIEFVEFIGYTKPKRIIFNKLDTDYDISPRITRYAKEIILGDIKRHGVEQVFFILGKTSYEYYSELPKNSNFVLPFVICTSLDEVYAVV